MPAPGRPAARPAGRTRSADWIDLDFCFVLVTFTVALFGLQLPLVAPAVFICFPLLYGALRKARLATALARCGPILILPLFCLLSTTWSLVPGKTAYYAVEYLLTVVCALLIGCGMAGSSILNGLFVAFFLYAGSNVLLGIRAGAFHPGAFGRDPFIGMAASKNVQGDLSALAVMIGLTMLIGSVRSRRPAAALVAAMLVVSGTALGIAALSTGALASLVVGAIVIAGLSLVAALPLAARSAAFIAGAAAACVAALTRGIWLEPLLATVMRAGGKDTTLTGRTYIWSRAEVMIQSRPILGLGFNAFWNRGSLEAEAIWRRLNIANRAGFNFHNSRLDLLVHLGYVGLILFAAIFAVYGAVLFIRNLRSPTSIGILLVAILFYEASRMGFETVIFGIFSHTSFLLYMALGWGCRERLSIAGRVASSSRVRSANIHRAR